ncbi:hypothetical protein GI582_18205 [Sulfitobacter sp. BDSS02]|nr:hypothetical protein [Sulfitobacter sp. BDSS02]MBR9852063.1 hypothetical protein [Paracoccaceae bacterium]
MAKHALQTVTAAAPQEITAGDVATISVQNQSGEFLLLFPGVDGAAPETDAAPIMLPPAQMFVNEALTDLFPGVSGVNRVFAQARRGQVSALVSHA